MGDNILDIFVGNEEISGTILEKFKDQPDNVVRVALVTAVNSYTKMLTVRSGESSYSIYSGYKDGLPHSGGINYNSVTIPIDSSRPNVVFSFWKAKDLGLLERITDRNYPASQVRGYTVIVSWPNKSNQSRFMMRVNRCTPDSLGLNSPF